ncbi:protein of unknown function [Lachnospiraceae bacterium C7]|nr:protein of unknown function [Lachnospiraceae bacterium C7]
MNVPKDPVMLLSFVNTQLRDNYSSLEEFTKAYNLSVDELVKSLDGINYKYDESLNKFI